MSITGIMTKLVDKDTSHNLDESVKEVPAVIEMTNDSIYISPKGYGDCGSADGYGCPVMLEIWQGQLRVVVWADINQEDPTHIISLEGAKEDKRKPYLCPYHEDSLDWDECSEGFDGCEVEKARKKNENI